MHQSRPCLNRLYLNFNFCAALAFHNLDKYCTIVEKEKIIKNKEREESWMEVEGNQEAQRNTVASHNRSGNASMGVREAFNPSQIQSRTEQIKEKLMKYKQGKKAQIVPMPTITPDSENKDISQIILAHFSNELRPKILSKYPTAPDDKINKVILQKWNTLQQAKKDAYTRATLKKIQSAKQAKKQQEQRTQIYTQQEEVLVKQQAPQPQHEPEPIEQKIEAKQNRFGDFLNRIKKNIKGMEEQNQKNKVFKEENEAADEGEGEQRMEEQHNAMKEEKQGNEDDAQEKHQQEYQEQGRSVNNEHQQQQSQTDEMQQQK